MGKGIFDRKNEFTQFSCKESLFSAMQSHGRDRGPVISSASAFVCACPVKFFAEKECNEFNWGKSAAKILQSFKVVMHSMNEKKKKKGTA